MSTPSTPTAPARPVSAAERAESEPLPWVANGLAAGLLGASIVALFFLLVDLLAGRPFWTPTLLGAALFRGELPTPGTPAEALMVAACTAVHVAVFVGFAVPAAFWALARLPSARGPGRSTLLALAFFAGLRGRLREPRRAVRSRPHRHARRGPRGRGERARRGRDGELPLRARARRA
jgi:hypothetical protein